MEHQKYIRSQEADQILKTMPTGILRCGIGLLSIVVIGLLVLCYFVKYPSTIHGNAVFHFNNDTVLSLSTIKYQNINVVKAGQKVLIQFEPEPGENEYTVLEGKVLKTSSNSVLKDSIRLDILLNDNHLTHPLTFPSGKTYKGSYGITISYQRLLLKFLGK